MSRCGLNDTQVAELVGPLAGKIKLKELDLSNNKAGAKGANALAGLLSDRNNQLKYLDLSDNEIKYPGAAALSIGLANNKTLNVLTLTNNHIGDEGASAWAGVLQASCLTQLQVSGNSIGSAGASEVEFVAKIGAY